MRSRRVLLAALVVVLAVACVFVEAKRHGVLDAESDPMSKLQRSTSARFQQVQASGVYDPLDHIPAIPGYTPPKKVQPVAPKAYVPPPPIVPRALSPFNMRGAHIAWTPYNPQNLKLIGPQTPSMKMQQENVDASTWFGNWWNLQQMAGAVHSLFYGFSEGTLTAEQLQYTPRYADGSNMVVATMYNIPHRDCGGASGGGAKDEAEYNQYIDRFVAEVMIQGGTPGREHAMLAVILEPDALAHAASACSGMRSQRTALLRSTVQKLKAANIGVYIDAGNADWTVAQPVTMAKLLVEAGVAQAAGFSINVANFVPVARSVPYGNAISQELAKLGVPNVRYVIDTSRNGKELPHRGEWCNPPGASIGPRPTTGVSVQYPLVDAFLWIKPPGASDGAYGRSPPGNCNCGAEAGQFIGTAVYESLYNGNMMNPCDWKASQGKLIAASIAQRKAAGLP